MDTMDRIGIPSMVLMERAAMAVVLALESHIGDLSGKVLIVAGTGNNGGDGLAIGRILAGRGARVSFYIEGNPEKMTAEAKSQLMILQNSGFTIQRNLEDAEYDIVIDALFGVGLSREVTGNYRKTIERIHEWHETGSFVCSVDIPSGICADTGKILGCAVRADLTVTFAFAKRGHLLYPGREYCGELSLQDIGITEQSFSKNPPSAFYYEEKDVQALLPKRVPDGNKGTFGKVLLLAGSHDLCGACLLCGRGILRTGAGMLKIITPSCNRQVLHQALPEAMLYTYEEMPRAEEVRKSLAWADVIVAGPGMGTGENARFLIKRALEEERCPVVLDADGLNLLAADLILRELASHRPKGSLILTPHPGELVRLLQTDMAEYQKDRETLILRLAGELKCIIAAKDAVTFVVENGRKLQYINTSGNDGMACAGSGDVLAGIMGALLAQGMDGFEAACLGVYLHGLAGERASRLKGRYGMLAGDITEAIPAVLKDRKTANTGIRMIQENT